MARPTRLISEAELGRVTGHSPRALRNALVKAGTHPVKTEMVAHRQHRSYNEREALAALKESRLTENADARDSLSRHRASIADIRLGLKLRTHIRREDAKHAILGRMTEMLRAYRTVAVAYHEIAPFNAANPEPRDDPEARASLREKRREIFESRIAHIKRTMRRTFEWGN